MRGLTGRGRGSGRSDGQECVCTYYLPSHLVDVDERGDDVGGGHVHVLLFIEYNEEKE